MSPSSFEDGQRDARSCHPTFGPFVILGAKPEFVIMWASSNFLL